MLLQFAALDSCTPDPKEPCQVRCADCAYVKGMLQALASKCHGYPKYTEISLPGSWTSSAFRILTRIQVPASCKHLHDRESPSHTASRRQRAACSYNSHAQETDSQGYTLALSADSL